MHLLPLLVIWSLRSIRFLQLVPPPPTSHILRDIMSLTVNAREEIGPLLASLKRNSMFSTISKIVLILEGFAFVSRFLKNIKQLHFRAFLLRRPRVLSLPVVHYVDTFSAHEPPGPVRIIFYDAKQIGHAASW